MQETTPLLLGTRASPLAMAQTHAVMAALGGVGVAAQPKTFSTLGDRDQSKPLHALGDKGLFTAELEAALRSGEISAAVHSGKDLSAIDDPQLPLVAVLPRAARTDVLVTFDAASLADLPKGARVGTSSLRRAAQLQKYRSDLQVVSIRGNIQTRLAKFKNGAADALILAEAGLARANLLNTIAYSRLSNHMTAPCQGIIAIQAASTDQVWNQINCTQTFLAFKLERAMVRGLGAHCKLPVAAAANYESAVWHLDLEAWSMGEATKTSQISLSESLGETDLIRQAELLGETLREKLPPGFFEE